MTFEARDSAAKVVPARLKMGGGQPVPTSASVVGSFPAHRTAGSQTALSQLQQFHQRFVILHVPLGLCETNLPSMELVKQNTIICIR